MYGTNCTITWGPPDKIEVWQNCGRWAVKRGQSKCLNRDGSWGLGDWFASEREATVAAVLAGMESPEVKGLKEANATAQRRLAEKQKVLDQVSRDCDTFRVERDGARAGRDGALERERATAKQHDEKVRELCCEIHDARAAEYFAKQERDSLAAEVAKLKGDLAQAIVPGPTCVFVPGDPQGVKRLRDCAAIARGEPVDSEDTKSIAVKAVRKLRADYEAREKEIKDGKLVYSFMGNPRYEAKLASIVACAEGKPHIPADGWAYEVTKQLRAKYDAARKALS